MLLCQMVVVVLLHLLALLTQFFRHLLHGLHLACVQLRQGLKISAPLLLIVRTALLLCRPRQLGLDGQRLDLGDMKLLVVNGNVPLQRLDLIKQPLEAVVQRQLCRLIRFTPLHVLRLHGLESLTAGPQLLNLRRQSSLFVLQLRVDVRDCLGNLVQVAPLGLVDLGLLGRDILDLLLGVLVPLNPLGALHFIHMRIHNSVVLLQNLGRPIQDVQLHADIGQLLLHQLELLCLLPHLVDVLLKLITVQELVSLHPLILLLLLRKLRGQGLALGLSLLQVSLCKLLLFCDKVDLLLVDSQTGVRGVIFGLGALQLGNLVVHRPHIALQALDIRLSHCGQLEHLVELHHPLLLLLGVTLQSRQGVPASADIIPQVPQH
mmetsp:Transcript_10114/g.22312  ORF Transcript_10114/g.22312 Transcript_10114/m.22312 type:complete len:376 (+) Transcript_10114:322-1449(+)